MIITNESDLQRAIVEYANRFPWGKYLHSIPNGATKRMGLMKKNGMRKGVSDLFLAYPTKRYHGMYIEVKFGNRPLRPEQEEWLDAVDELGYAGAVIRDEADIERIFSYYFR